MKNRRGVFDAGIIILGAIVVIIAIIAATLAWSDILQVTYVSLITKMPKFDYVVQNGNESGNRNFEIYITLRTISFLLIVLVLMFAGMSIMFEKINLIPPETGFTIISKSIYFVFFFFFFPPLWDILATSVEQMSMWILNPEDPTNAVKNVEILLKKLGSIECADPNNPEGNCQFTLDALIAGITDPFGALKNIFQISFLGIFKAIAFLIFMFTSFLIGTIRQVLTAIVIIGLPVLLILSLMPFFKRIVDKFVDALLGLLIAPIFSSLVVVAGVAYLATLDRPDPLMEWFSSLAIMVLASLVPAMIVPMMGPVIGMVHGMTASAVSTGGMMAGIAGASATRGMVSAVSGIAQHGISGTSNSDLTKSIMTGPNLTTIAKRSLEAPPSAKASGADSWLPSNTESLGAVPDSILESLGIDHGVMRRASLGSKISLGNDNVADKNVQSINGSLGHSKNTFVPPAALFDALESKSANLIDDTLQNPMGNTMHDSASETGREKSNPSGMYGSFFGRFFKISRPKN